MADRETLPPAKQGRPPASLNGGGSLSARYAEEVYEIVRSLSGGEKRPVRFREIWPKLVPKQRHSNEVNWQRLTTERSLKMLTQAGWVERTIEGYRDLGPQLYAFHAARVEIDQLLEAGQRVLEEEPVGSGAEASLWLQNAAHLSLDFAATVGYWLRAFDQRFARRAEERGYALPQPQSAGLEAVGAQGSGLLPGLRAGMMAAEMADGYLMPEREDAIGTPGLHEARAEGPLSYRNALAKIEQSTIGEPQSSFLTPEQAEAKRLGWRKIARALAPDRREALRAQRTSWQNEVFTGYAREFDRDREQLASDIFREERLRKRLLRRSRGRSRRMLSRKRKGLSGVNAQDRAGNEA